MFVLVESLLTKSKVFGKVRKFWVSVWKSKIDFTNVPFLSVLLCSLRKANCAFQSRIQRLYRNIASFAHAANSWIQVQIWLWYFWIPQVFQVYFENCRFLFLMNLHQVQPKALFFSSGEICYSQLWLFLCASAIDISITATSFSVEIMHRWFAQWVNLIMCSLTADIVKQYIVVVN